MKVKTIRFKKEKFWKLSFISGILILMVDYELTCIFNPDLKDKQKLISKIEGWIKKIGGKIEKKEKWGSKDLVYRIKKFSRGFYVFWQLKAKADRINELFPKIKLEEDIIRYLLVRRE